MPLTPQNSDWKLIYLVIAEDLQVRPSTTLPGYWTMLTPISGHRQFKKTVSI